MAVKLRLKRIGRRKRPFYRIVAIDSRTRRDGAEIERLGWYDPLRTDVAVELQEDRIIHWLKQGAQPSETVNNILKEIGLKYKIHLMEEGKSEEQIASLLTEWQLRQEENRAIQLEKKEAKKKADAKAKVAKTEVVASSAAKAKEEAPVEEAPAEDPEVEAAAEETREETAEAPTEDVAVEEEAPSEELAKGKSKEKKVEDSE